MSSEDFEAIGLFSELPALLSPGKPAPTDSRTLKVYFYELLVNDSTKYAKENMVKALDTIQTEHAASKATIQYIKGGKIGTTIAFVKKYGTEKIYTFFLMKGKMDVGDEPVINLRTFEVQSLDKRLVLNADEGLGSYCIASYDYTNNIIALQSTRTPSKSDLETYLANLINGVVRLQHIQDVDADRMFELMEVKKFAVRVSIPNIEKAATLFGDSPESLIAAESDLIDYARKFDGDMISMEISADVKSDSDNAKAELKKSAIREESSKLRNLLGINIFSGRKKPKAVATGKVYLDDETVINNRAIDLVEGLLLWQGDVKIPQERSKALDYLEELIRKVTLETKGSIENARSEREKRFN